LVGVCACQVYDDSLSATQVDACVPQVEVCNGRDDDCDGAADEEDAVQVACQAQIVHGNSVCKSGRCVRTSCLAGYYTCDGLNENGCESACPCIKPCPADPADGGLQGADASF
jgi:hypothetical protein